MDSANISGAVGAVGLMLGGPGALGDMVDSFIRESETTYETGMHASVYYDRHDRHKHIVHVAFITRQMVKGRATHVTSCGGELMDFGVVCEIETADREVGLSHSVQHGFRTGGIYSNSIVQSMAKVMGRIDRAMAKMNEVEGEAQTFDEYVERIARAMKVKHLYNSRFPEEDTYDESIVYETQISHFEQTIRDMILTHSTTTSIYINTI